MLSAYATRCLLFAAAAERDGFHGLAEALRSEARADVAHNT